MSDKMLYAMKGPQDDWITNIVEYSEDWAWIVALHLRKAPSQLTAKDRDAIENSKQAGFSVVPVRLVEQSKEPTP